MAKEITILGKLDALGRLTVESDESCQAKIDVGGETWIESYTRGYKAGTVEFIGESLQTAIAKVTNNPVAANGTVRIPNVVEAPAKEWRSISSDGPETLNDESESEGAKVKL